MHRPDPQVLRRQEFGFVRPTPQDAAATARILSGLLTLSPHPEWQLSATIDWSADPFGQQNWVAQFHMLRWLEPLRRTAERGDSQSREYWLRTARSWVEANPSDAPAHSSAWNVSVDAYRAQALLFGSLIAGDDDLEWLVPAIIAHGDWLTDSRHRGRANHALHQDQALFVLGRAMDRADWTALAVDRLNELVESEYDQQGMNKEGAPAYHRDNLIGWTTALERLRAEDAPLPPAAGRLRLAAEALAHATRPDGHLELIGDTPLLRPTGVDASCLDYVLTEGDEGEAPADLAAVYDRGYIFGRSGWGDFARDFSDETFYSVSFGSAHRVHGHQDGGSLTLFTRGRSWFADSGRWAYEKSPMNEYTVSREAHNVVVVDRPYDPNSVVRLTSSTLTPTVDDFTLVDQGYSGVRLSRRVIYFRGGDFLVVIDSIRSNDPVRATQLWHLGPGIDATRGDRSAELTTADGAAGRIRWFGTAPQVAFARGSEDPVQGWHCPGWRERTPVTVIEGSHTGTNFRFITFIAARGADEFDVSLLPSERGTLGFVVRGRNQDFQVTITADSATATLVGRDGPRATQTVGNPIDRLREMLRSRGADADAFAPNSTVAELRRTVRTAGGDRQARLNAAARLVDRVADSGDDSASAAIVDFLGEEFDRQSPRPADLLGLQRKPLLPWGGEERVHPTYKAPMLAAAAAIANLNPETPTVGTVERGRLTMPFIARDGDGDELFVRLHGAIDRPRVELPFFQGLRTDLAEHRAFLNLQDPSLDLDRSLRLSWFLGDTDTDGHELAADVIRAVAERLSKSRIVVHGTSGGGFAALQVVARIDGAVAVVANPQTVLRNYYATIFADALQHCFDRTPADLLNDALAQRLSAVARLAAQGTRAAHVVYLQNDGDSHHLTRHHAPMRAQVEESSLRDLFTFRTLKLGRGHVRVPASVMTREVTAAFALTQPIT